MWASVYTYISSCGCLIYPVAQLDIWMHNLVTWFCNRTIWELPTGQYLVVQLGGLKATQLYNVEGLKLQLLVNSWLCVRESHDCYAVAVKREGVLCQESYQDYDHYDTYFLYWPHFLLLSLVASTSLLARAITCEDRHRDKGPFRSGRPFLGFK